jgi:hypothetical protein
MRESTKEFEFRSFDGFVGRQLELEFGAADGPVGRTLPGREFVLDEERTAEF